MYTGQLATFTNREDWAFPVFEIVDDDTGELVDLTSATIVYEIFDREGCPVKTGSTDDGGVTRPDSTSFEIVVPRSSITGECTSGLYSMGITLENGGRTTSLFAGSITIIRGNVPS